MGDHGEVGKVALYAGVQDGLGPGVAEGGAVLVQEVHQLLGGHGRGFVVGLKGERMERERMVKL